MRRRNKPFKTSKFYKYAETYRQQLTEEEEIFKIDMTDEFNEELDNMVKNNEIIIININAKVRLGKSTLAITLGKSVFDLLIKYNYRSPMEKFSMRNIARDQQEKSRMMRDPELQFTVVVTDEDNELEHGGENSSAEEQLQKVFSDVQAGRYVHSISCSPKEIIDPNADIMLSVVAMDKPSKTTRCKLYYRYYEGGNDYIQLLGFVDIYVGDTIKVWEEKVKRIFLKTEKTEQEKKEIEYWAKRDFYVEYMIKKYEKMELITREGIFRPRVLEYAGVILRVAERLKPLTKMPTLLNSNIVRNFVKKEMREYKIPTSIVGEELATREVSGIVDLWKGFHKLTTEVLKFDKATQRLKKQLLNEEDKKVRKALEMEADTLQAEGEDVVVMRNEILNAIQLQLQELEHYKEIYDKYNRQISIQEVKTNDKDRRK